MSRPPSGSERARSASQSAAVRRLMLLAGWGSWWVFGSQLRLSKAETLLHFRLAEFQVPLDTESRSYNRPKLSVDLSTGSSGLYITPLGLITLSSWHPCRVHVIFIHISKRNNPKECAISNHSTAQSHIINATLAIKSRARHCSEHGFNAF